MLAGEPGGGFKVLWEHGEGRKIGAVELAPGRARVGAKLQGDLARSDFERKRAGDFCVGPVADEDGPGRLPA